jgi:hypothetical protein
MGRAGLEPATLGLKVRRKRLRPAAGSGNVLQNRRCVMAASCWKLHTMETYSYSHSYSRAPVSKRLKEPLSQPAAPVAAQVRGRSPTSPSLRATVALCGPCTRAIGERRRPTKVAAPHR